MYVLLLAFESGTGLQFHHQYTIHLPQERKNEEYTLLCPLKSSSHSVSVQSVVLQLNPKSSPPCSQSPEMVLDLQLAFSILLAGLVLLCVFVAKLREMAEAGRAAHQGPILRPLKDEADVVLLGSRDQHECKRRVRFEYDTRRCDGLKGFSGKSGLSEESTEEGAANSSCPREIMIEKQSEETEVKGRTEEPRNCRGWSDDQEQEYDNDDDWEGIEKTELERAFDQAVLFFESLKISGLGSGIGNDEKMMLYGLHKIATEGPCHEPQPLPFKVSARAKWNAWQQLGTMSPEDAMKQYIDLVSAISPKGMQNDITGR